LGLATPARAITAYAIMEARTTYTSKAPPTCNEDISLIAEGSLPTIASIYANIGGGTSATGTR
jgi:hypothetical protein